MMKRICRLRAGTAGVMVILSLVNLGCGKKGETPDTADAGSGAPAAAPVIDVSKVQRLFESAPAAIKSQWEQEVAAVKSANYSGALKSLQSLAGDARLSTDQKAAIDELVAQVKSRANEAWRGAAEAANKVINEATDAAAEAREKANKAAKELLPK